MNLFKKKEMIPVILHLNVRVQPIQREIFFEDIFKKLFFKSRLGKVTGGGTYFASNGEPKSCDMEMLIKKDKLDILISLINHLPIFPKGSKLIFEDNEIDVGCAEGLAIYLNGTELPMEIYQNYDSNDLVNQLNLALKDIGEFLGYFEGNYETVLYYYGKSYAEMKEKINPIIEDYPLCQKCRITQIA